MDVVTGLLLEYPVKNATLLLCSHTQTPSSSKAQLNSWQAANLPGIDELFVKEYRYLVSLFRTPSGKSSTLWLSRINSFRKLSQKEFSGRDSTYFACLSATLS